MARAIAIGGILLGLAGTPSPASAPGGSQAPSGADVKAQAEELEHKADANPFERPPGEDAVSPPRLAKFLEVRKTVFAFYEAHRSELDALKNPVGGYEGAVAAQATRIALECRLVHARARVGAGMSKIEYQYYLTTITRAASAADPDNNFPPNVPAPTMDLYRRYEADIRKYSAMDRLEYLLEP
jgi:hypothetical protein